MSDLSAPTEPEPLRLGAVLRQTGTILWRIGGQMSAAFFVAVVALYAIIFPLMIYSTRGNSSDDISILLVILHFLVLPFIFLCAFPAMQLAVYRNLETTPPIANIRLAAINRFWPTLRWTLLCVAAVGLISYGLGTLLITFPAIEPSDFPTGLLFYGVPLVFISAIWGVIHSSIVIDGLGPLAALRRCRRLTRGRRDKVFMTFLLLFLLSIALFLAFLRTIDPLMELYPESAIREIADASVEKFASWFVFYGIILFVFCAVATIWAIVTTVLFHQLRQSEA